LTEDEDGARELGKLTNRYEPAMQQLSFMMRRDYEAAARERQATIAAAVERENARLAKLPLAGGVFIDRHGPWFEFRDGNRVYLTMTKDAIFEAAYEVDGDKVIIRAAQGNMVMVRDGAWLKGQGLKLKRQAKQWPQARCQA
jgi:hypothetical protein